jgi:glycosyltransferase involved in cell wall biosynthesis
MKIALYCDDFLGWQGGVDFFRLILESLKAGSLPDDQITIVAQRVLDTLPWRLARLGNHVLKRFPWDCEWMAREIGRIPKEELLRQAFGRSARVEWIQAPAALSNWSRLPSAFDVIGPLVLPPSDQCACVGYIPDCQHRRLPHNFSAEERARRDRRFSDLLQIAPVVIVNSGDVKRDVINCYGPVSAEIVALPFAAAPWPDWFDIDVPRVLRKYDLPPNYFMCSNQFWIHKNHVVIIEALALAKAAGMSHRVVFTGDTTDHRDPGHFQRLVQRAEELGVEQNCHFLGLLPKLDQIGLMRAATAVIQSTLFEGGPGGGAVHDAVALGKRIMLSDIPINREIEQYVDEYFAPTDSRALHLAMCRVEQRAKLERPINLLLQEGQERRVKCGSILRSAFSLAVERTKLRTTAVPLQHRS